MINRCSGTILCMNVNKLGPDSRPRSSLLCAPGRLRAFLRGVYFVGLVYPLPHFGLLSHVEEVQDEPAQNVSMRAPETTAVVPNGSHYRDSQCTPSIIVTQSHLQGP